ncbi:DNA cytosine methyltransferase [uncultured Selenomonas sp.]|uniref:DNA cytosine methyltransferase n=1 Tax=uncultured Selenomonas sp. TaxID=159275 RepID=UPI002674E922|nr:DNA cytosine methyltransferase [uncultured Selenomonas sp.]
MTLGSLFDGIGGWLLAARHAGVTPVWASEIEPFPCSVTARHFPDVKQLGDITKINPDEIEPVDIICAGSPCQDLSIAGKRKGLDGERSGLFRTAVDLVRRMRERTAGKYPRFFVWENVPGAFSSNRGMDFQAVLEEIGQTEIPTPDGGKWANAGMVECDECQIAWRVLDAQYWGVPQRRRRIFLVADFAADGRCAGEILFESEGVPWNSAESKGTRKGAARGTEDCARTSGEYIPKTARTLTARMDGSPCADRGPQIVATNALTPWDVQSRRIYDENGKMVALYSGEGRGSNNGAVFVRAAGFNGKAGPSSGGISYTKECTPTLIADHPMYVAIYDMTHADEVMRPVKDGIVPTLNARMGTGGNQVPVVHAYCIAGNTIDRKIENGGNGKGVLAETAYTLNTIDRHAVAQIYGAKSYSEYEAGKVATLRASGGAYGGGSENLALSYSVVRRLTPTECERLQGLTDGYTEGGSDTARYKALGNGMAQPCADYVIRRIVECAKEVQ